MGGRLFGGADHGSQNVGLERRAWPLAQAVSGSVGSQSTATNVPALRVGTDRSWRPQERSADGGAGRTWRLLSITSLARGRGAACRADAAERLSQAAHPARRTDARRVIDHTPLPKTLTHSV